MAEEEHVTRHLWISGRVQGVWYRESMRLEAERLGVTGWVRNLPDGRVEAMVAGNVDNVGALINWAWKGPPMAKVSHIEIEPANHRFSTFAKW